ncbi:MAG: uracil-xanthine permease [Lachnospiraceae bacterium]|nr:uracil-xanthine permease [Lachnospiraceae bacterium]
MKLAYGISDRPGFGKLVVFAIQQLLAIMAATLVVPIVINNGQVALGNDNPMMSSAAALFGAGIGTLVYVLFTKRKSPVFLGSSFAFLGSMASAFAGATSMALGYIGLVIGAVFAGLVYVVIAIIVKFVGTSWIDRLMPPVVIGPTVAIIGLSLAGNAIGDLRTASAGGHTLLAILCGLTTLIVVILCSVFGKKTAKLIPFIIGILAGYALAAILTAIGAATDTEALMITDFSAISGLFKDGVTLKSFVSVPDFTFITAFKGFADINGAYLGTIAVAYIPVAFVVFAEHIADHKNISSIVDKDLLKEPGLSRTLLGDGVGSMAGAFFGGCPNTTYGESIACVAITGNASVATIITAAIGAILISFLSPFVAFVNTIPSCVMGGVCVALYGFIAVSGLKMIQGQNLSDNRNLFVVSTILVSGIGGLSLTFGAITITSIATALILGIIVNLIVSKRSDKKTVISGSGNDESKDEQEVA